MNAPATLSPVKPFVSLDALECDPLESFQAVSQATHRFLRLLREFDLRQGWRAYGTADCAQWLDWRCGISRNTAQEKVRVARAFPEDPTRSLFSEGADALVHLARERLAGREPGGSTSDVHQVVVHVDAAALRGEGGEADLPLPTVRRLCCDGPIVPLAEDANGAPLNVGRRQRTVPTAMKRALLARDRHCTYPGCHHERFLDAHHVQHWSAGGETSLGNLLTLCTVHHALVHEGGFGIARHPDGRYYFTRPDGRAVEANPSTGENRVRESPPPYRRGSSSAEDCDAQSWRLT